MLNEVVDLFLENIQFKNNTSWMKIQNIYYKKKMKKNMKKTKTLNNCKIFHNQLRVTLLFTKKNIPTSFLFKCIYYLTRFALTK